MLLARKEAVKGHVGVLGGVLAYRGLGVAMVQFFQIYLGTGHSLLLRNCYHNPTIRA